MSIGTLGEFNLHNSLKELYKESGDELEKKVDGFIIDLVRDDLLVEFQTKNFSAIKNKLKRLLEHHKVLLVYPIVTNKWIKFVSGKRLSPKHCNVYNLFDELVYIPKMIKNPNFMIETIQVNVLEEREKKRVSWRKDWIVKERKLLNASEKTRFNSPDDFMKLIPNNIKSPFSNNDLAEELKLPKKLVRKMTYCLKKMGVLQVAGKRGNSFLFEHF
jgi:hypothetical protein